MTLANVFTFIFYNLKLRAWQTQFNDILKKKLSQSDCEDLVNSRNANTCIRQPTGKLSPVI